MCYVLNMDDARVAKSACQSARVGEVERVRFLLEKEASHSSHRHMRFITVNPNRAVYYIR